MKRKELQNKYEKILKKLKDEKFKLDISRDEDLSFAVMNLISIEEHAFMSAVKTGNKKYLDILNEVRNLRKELMKELVKNVEEGAETWCMSKHLLSATMRLEEVGTKILSEGNKEKAMEIFNKAYTAYTLFWSLNLGLFNVEEVKEEIKKDKDIEKEVKESEKLEQEISESEKEEKAKSFSEKIKQAFKSLLNCCIE
ncbi:MAG: hypothetical protein QXL82_03525 [Candidatus Aenigmatarchaeota archaeon]